MTEKETVEEFESASKSTWRLIEGGQGKENVVRIGGELNMTYRNSLKKFWHQER